MSAIKSAIFLVMFLGLVGCDSQQAQEDFLDAANARPSGFTERRANLDIVSVDEDDWRTAPSYRALIDVQPAYPNPSNGATVSIEVLVQHGGAVQGTLTLWGEDQHGQLRNLDQIVRANTPGFYTFRFPSSILGDNELARVYIYDEVSAAGGLVSYGDIQL